MKNKLFKKQVIDDNGRELPLGSNIYGLEFAGVGVVLLLLSAIIPGIVFVSTFVMVIFTLLFAVGSISLYLGFRSKDYRIALLVIAAFLIALIANYKKHSNEVKDKALEQKTAIITYIKHQSC